MQAHYLEYNILNYKREKAYIKVSSKFSMELYWVLATWEGIFIHLEHWKQIIREIDAGDQLILGSV